MLRLMKLSTLAFLFCFLSMTTDACEDNLSGCSRFHNSCGNSFFRKNCQKTCGTCPIGLCSENRGGCKHICNDTSGVVVCSCENGYKLAADNKDCIDIDECMEGPNPCNKPGFPAYCVNRPGDYMCQVQECSSINPETMNYYKSGKCCRLRNDSCGMTEEIRNRLNEAQSEVTITQSRVFGGVNALSSSWPWMAQILIQGAQHCGGSLISHRWFVSAAHCFTDHSFSNMVVYFGDVRSARLSFGATTRRVRREIRRVIIHENYDVYHENDIALVELKEAVSFNEVVSPICLPCGETPKAGDKCWVTGFGRTVQDSRETASILQEVDVPIVDVNACSNAYKDHYYINKATMMCAGYDIGGKDTCEGDSGGPLACQRADSCEWYLSGITSFGKGCAIKGFFGVYVNVVNYENWIRTNIGDDAPGLCTRKPKKCTGLSNKNTGCYERVNQCKLYPAYMQANCQLTCCQAKYKEIPDCYDKESPMLCELNKGFCFHPFTIRVMLDICKKTCKFC